MSSTWVTRNRAGVGRTIAQHSDRRAFSGYISYLRKVGTRNAQAISKVALAGLALAGDGGTIEDIRIGAASLRETYPLHRG